MSTMGAAAALQRQQPSQQLVRLLVMLEGVVAQSLAGVPGGHGSQTAPICITTRRNSQAVSHQMPKTAWDVQLNLCVLSIWIFILQNPGQAVIRAVSKLGFRGSSRYALLHCACMRTCMVLALQCRRMRARHCPAGAMSGAALTFLLP